MEQIPPYQKDLSKSVKVILLNKSGIIIDEFFMKAGANLWVFIRKRGIPIGSACSGVGVCGACNIKILIDNPTAISTQNEFEKETLSKNNKSIDNRLACLCRVFSDLTIKADYW